MPLTVAGLNKLSSWGPAMFSSLLLPQRRGAKVGNINHPSLQVGEDQGLFPTAHFPLSPGDNLLEKTKSLFAAIEHPKALEKLLAASSPADCFTEEPH